MNLLKKLLYQYHLLELDCKTVEDWIENHQMEDLKFALQNGNYKVRALVLSELGNIKFHSFTHLIVEKLDDKVKMVSCAAISTLEKMGTTPEIQNKVDAKIKYWKEKEILDEEKRKKFKHRTESDAPKWERPSKKTLENVKQMLKKPMIGGKWF
jgi:septin family protein